MKPKSLKPGSKVMTLGPLSSPSANQLDHSHHWHTFMLVFEHIGMAVSTFHVKNFVSREVTIRRSGDGRASTG